MRPIHDITCINLYSLITTKRHIIERVMFNKVLDEYHVGIEYINKNIDHFIVRKVSGVFLTKCMNIATNINMKHNESILDKCFNPNNPIKLWKTSR